MGDAIWNGDTSQTRTISKCLFINVSHSISLINRRNNDLTFTACIGGDTISRGSVIKCEVQFLIAILGTQGTGVFLIPSMAIWSGGDGFIFTVLTDCTSMVSPTVGSAKRFQGDYPLAPSVGC